MAILKAGDRVEFIDESGRGDSRAVQGDRGTIKTIDSSGLARVDMDSGVTIHVVDTRLRGLPFEASPIVTGMPARLIQINIPGEFKVGDRVMLATEEPEYGRGEVDMFEVGTVRRLGPGSYADAGDIIVEFPTDYEWIGVASDLRHAPSNLCEEFDLPQEVTPEIPLDEAVKGCQDIRQQIAGLNAQAKVFEEVMRKAGIKFI